MICAIIQARMGSSRLPGKVLLDLCGKSVLEHVISRVGHSKKIDKIVVATSVDQKNDAIRDFCSLNNFDCFSGSEDDVLDRYYKAALAFGVGEGDYVIRITADCPIIDPIIIDQIIDRINTAKADYVSNDLEPSFPNGVDCEIMRFESLKKAWEQAELKFEREHVTQYIIRRPEMFKLENVKNDVDLSNMRWTLDHPEDFTLISWIFEKLYRPNSIFNTNQVLELLNNNKNNEIIKVNSHFIRNESLINDIKNEINGE